LRVIFCFARPAEPAANCLQSWFGVGCKGGVSAAPPSTPSPPGRRGGGGGVGRVSGCLPRSGHTGGGAGRLGAASPPSGSPGEVDSTHALHPMKGGGGVCRPLPARLCTPHARAPCSSGEEGGLCTCGVCL
jgi:hypothetical protein